MTLPRELQINELRWITQGLHLVIRDIEETLNRQFNNSLEKREQINYSAYNELLDRIKTCENLKRSLSSNKVIITIPEGELIRQKDGTITRQPYKDEENS